MSGTPTLFVNGRKIDPLPETYSAFEAQVRTIAPAAFAGAPAAPAAAPAAPSDTGGKVTGQSPAQP